ncbi:hypothetical protein GCM10023084_63030 [Streptomyces lacrimifluminis]|uniref:Uncharacterized protein n=1 Tax=Streptomyces lacrimifluminis TaxID=1500077 RepID=A0A917NYR2_9ACTN|nr:hypothetical protein GCM10012282_44080 [Streptomyces lacrimifluminis]
MRVAVQRGFLNSWAGDRVAQCVVAGGDEADAAVTGCVERLAGYDRDMGGVQEQPGAFGAARPAVGWARSVTSQIAVVECGPGVTDVPAAASASRRSVPGAAPRDGNHRTHRHDPATPGGPGRTPHDCFRMAGRQEAGSRMSGYRAHQPVEKCAQRLSQK